MGERIWVREAASREDAAEGERDAYLPDPSLTPGSVVLHSWEAICKEGYAELHRAVSQKDKQKVFRRYGIPWTARQGYDVDHLVPLSLGGSNDMRNLWPHPYHAEYGPRVKSALEARLRSLVRGGLLALEEAQRVLAENWLEALKRFL